MKILLSLFVLCFAYSASAKIRLALNWKAEPQFGGFYAAKDEFAKNNLEVEILEGGSGTPTLQMLAAGQVDYAIVSADEVILAKDRGNKDIIALYAVYQTNPQGIMTHAERGFKKLEDVFKSEGTLLWQSGLPYAQFISKKYSSMKVKTAPYTGGLAAFQHDPKISQQCFVTSEPLSARKAGLKVQTFLISEAGYNPYTTVVVTKKSHWEKNTKQVKTFVQSVRQGWQSYLKDPSSANKTMGELNKAMTAETFAESALAQKPLIETPEAKTQGLGSMSETRWKELIDQVHDLKLIKSKPMAKDLFVNL